MSTEEAKIYVDEVVELLVEMGVISADRYGRMTEQQRETLAERVVAKSEE